MPPTDLPTPSVPVAVKTFTFAGGAPRPSDRPVAVEIPVNIVYGTVPYAVMMMTPGDLEDFAVGFSLTEGVIEARGDVRAINVEHDPQGIRVMVDLVPTRLHRLLARRRAMNGRTSCGVCGIEDLASIPRIERRAGEATQVRLAAIRRALDGLGSHQTLNGATRAVHAAAWAGHDGVIACVREDVGRHNALDKLLGALFRRGVCPADGFLLITSRCSYEMVEKVAAFGAGILVAISAPTSLGVDRARHHDITLVGIARHDTATVFSGADRIVADQEALA